MSTPPSLCYAQAYRKKKAGEITEKEYFYHLFQHVSRTGIEHKGDERVHSNLEKVDPLGYSINCMIVNMMEPVDDPTPFEDVFDAYRNGTIGDIKTKLANLKPSYEPKVRKLLALLSLQERNAPVLKWLLDDGIETYEAAFEDEARRVQKGKDSETWKLLHESNFKTIVPWKQPKTRGSHPLA